MGGVEEIRQAVMKKLLEISEDGTLTAAQRKEAATKIWDDIIISEIFEPDMVARLYHEGFEDFVAPPVTRLAETLRKLSSVVAVYADRPTESGGDSPLRTWIVDKLIEAEAAASRDAYDSRQRAREIYEKQNTEFLLSALATLSFSPNVSRSWAQSLGEDKISEVITEGGDVTLEFGSVASAFAAAGDTTPTKKYDIPCGHQIIPKHLTQWV